LADKVKIDNCLFTGNIIHPLAHSTPIDAIDECSPSVPVPCMSFASISVKSIRNDFSFFFQADTFISASPLADQEDMNLSTVFTKDARSPIQTVLSSCGSSIEIVTTSPTGEWFLGF